MSMRIKICGITRLEDALAAADLGADLLGFNFYPGSPRAISPAACAAIQEGLARHRAAIATVGVFVNEDAARIRSILADCSIDYAQLSGDEPPADIEILHDIAFKTIRPRSTGEAGALAEIYANPHIHPTLLLDSFSPDAYGGTGQQPDLALAAALTHRHPLLLAGGLNPDNVRAAADRVRPWGVDVASGVEKAPGVKDAQKMARFIEAVRSLPVRELKIT